MAHMSATNDVAAEVVVRLIPDVEAIEAFGPDINDRAAWGPAYQAGVRQAPDAARRIRACAVIT
jgi:NTE family protein